MGYRDYIKRVKEELSLLRVSQRDAVDSAARLIADSIMAGGIIQSFGSGHSNIGSTEIVARAGGLIPTKEIVFPKSAQFEMVEGLGTRLVENVDVRPEDVFVIISYSGRNPLPIEVAAWVKEQGNPLIVVTSLDNSKQLTSRHSSGKMVYQFADVILDVKGPMGDAAMEVPGLDTKVCPISTMTTAVLVNSMILRSLEIMVERGYHPPVFMSDNLDGGPEYNKRLQDQYAERIYMNDTFPGS